MHRRTLKDGTVLAFGHAGILHHNSFVMYDRATESLWVHVTGRAERGPYAGTQLEMLPSTVTTWGRWKAAYPHTTVLPGHRRDGFMGHYEGLGRGRSLGLSVVVRFQAKLYAFEGLEKEPVLNDTFRETPLLVVYDLGTGSATAWSRTTEAGRTLTFRGGPEGEGEEMFVEDEQTGSRWHWLTGEATAGPLQGQLLRAVQYNPILIRRFHAFYPGAPVWGR